MAVIKPSSLERLASRSPGDVQGITADQLALLKDYYSNVLMQAWFSFAVAAVLSAAGALVMFWSISKGSGDATLGVVGGVVVQVVSGLVLYLYKLTTDQLGRFHHRLDGIQRIVIANSLSESLEQPARDKLKAAVITAVIQTFVDASAAGSGDATTPAPASSPGAGKDAAIEPDSPTGQTSSTTTATTTTLA